LFGLLLKKITMGVKGEIISPSGGLGAKPPRSLFIIKLSYQFINCITVKGKTLGGLADPHVYGPSPNCKKKFVLNQS
jgi:hypothetical protein